VGVTVVYRVSPARPEAHLFRVVMELADPNPAGQALRLPAWIPGSYTIRDFARHLVEVQAAGPDGPVALRKVDKDTWVAAPTAGPLTVTAWVYAWELTVRTAHLDTTHGFFNPTSLCLCAVGHEAEPHALVLEPGEHACAQGWRVATTLRQTEGKRWGWGRYEAADYDDLIDHPVELGDFVHTSFEACGVLHDVVITGRVRCDLVRLASDLSAICEEHITRMGAPAPFERYLFLTMAVGDGYGGLEHRDSTALICKRADLPQPGATAVSDGYRAFLGLCSHEYFHAWNVKRLKPAAFVPYDLWRENHTRLLWAFEGLTSYFDDLALVRSGRIDVGSWLELLGKTATGVARAHGARVQTLEDASFDAWTRYYKQDENTPNALVSYYTKGALAGLCVDLHLRALGGGRSLDAVMAALWARWGDGSGVPEGGVEEVIRELGGPDTPALLDAALRGTGELPLAALLATIGVRTHTRAAKGDDDGGGTPGPVGGGEGDLGVKAASAPGGARLVHVYEGGAAQAAGLSAGDVVVALDSLAVDAKGLIGRARGYPPGSRVLVHAFRRDELMVFDVALGAPPQTTVWFDVDPEAPDDAIARRQALLAPAGAPRLPAT
jgi:predicted metalloprotease with PDZ domain